MGNKKDFFDNVFKRRSIKVFFTSDDGQKTELFNDINGTPESIINYYGNNWFNFGDSEENPKDLMMVAEGIHFLDEDIIVKITYSTHKGGNC